MVSYNVRYALNYYTIGKNKWLQDPSYDKARLSFIQMSDTPLPQDAIDIEKLGLESLIYPSSVLLLKSDKTFNIISGYMSKERLHQNKVLRTSPNYLFRFYFIQLSGKSF